jgi:hypothetical protein
VGEAKKHCFKLNFADNVMAYFKGSEITSDGGLLAIRELDEKMGLTAMAENYLTEKRYGRNVQHNLTELLRQSIFSRLAGYEDVNDANQLRKDPALRIILGERALKKNGSSESTVGKFETEILTEGNNLEKLDEMLMDWIAKVDSIRGVKEIVLDMDSSESPVYGDQEGSAYNGYFGSKCYHPIFCFNQYGDCLKAKLRPGNVHSADGYLEFIEPVLRNYVSKGFKVTLRADAAFGIPKLYELCEELGVDYVIRLKENNSLAEGVSELLKKPGEENKDRYITLYKDIVYQAKSWDKARRVIAKIEHHPDELFPRVGFIITNLKWRNKKVVKFYNKRGTCEQWIKEGKNTLTWTKLSCKRFKENEARLKLFLLAYDLGNFLRTLVLPKKIKHWSLKTIQLKLIKTGGRLIKHARYYCLLLAEVSITEKIFSGLMNNIRKLSPASG